MFKLLYEQAGDPPGGGAPPSITDPPAASGGGTPPAAAPAVQPDAGGGASGSWLEGLGDLGKDPSLQMFKDPASLAKSWVSAQKMIGAEKIVIPGKEATDEDWENLYNKLGRPKSADEYKFELPEGAKEDEKLSKEFKSLAHKAGLTPRQAQAIVEWDAKQKLEMAKTYESSQQAQLKQSLDAYKQSLGGEEKFKATVDKARVAVRALADDGFKAFLRDSGVGSRPEAIAFFAKLAEMMGEDKIRDGTGVPFTNEDPAQIKAQIEDIEAKMFKDINNTNMAAWVDQRDKLYNRLHALRGGA